MVEGYSRSRAVDAFYAYATRSKHSGCYKTVRAATVRSPGSYSPPTTRSPTLPAGISADLNPTWTAWLSFRHSLSTWGSIHRDSLGPANARLRSAQDSDRRCTPVLRMGPGVVFVDVDTTHCVPASLSQR